MTETNFPAPLASDADDVVIALKSARSLWDADDYAEAARWLRKAASAAQAAGDDDRALQLAKLASEVETTPGIDPSAGATPTAASSTELPYTQAIRVAVKRSVRDGDLFVARLLDNQPVPSGSHEAFLVLTDPNLDLFDPAAS